mgnify:CR=1 FL=1
MNDYWKYKRGSEWRKWDLHVHTKGTNKSDQFSSQSFDDFCKVFFRKALEQDIKAIGVTDYFSVSNYLKIIEFVRNINDCDAFNLEEKAEIKEIFILPNVELRMMPSTDKSRLVNIHCIFNPDYVKSLDNNFFGSIEYSAGVGRKYKMNYQGMVDLGKSLDNSLVEEQAYHKGVNSFVVSHSDLQKLLDENSEFRENTIIVVSNSNKDGASAFNKHFDLFENDSESCLDAVRKSIYSISQCIFSGNEEDRKYFLGEKGDNVQTVIQKCGSLKPCIHGSDSHKEEDLFKPKQDRFCWIKSDLTFSGLKQIIFEPSDRVRIQPIKPDSKNERHIISEVQFISSDKLFGNQKILLNENLNAIIGGKSSGKSLLLHSIAESIDPEQVKRINKRLNFEGYSFENENYDFEVTWKNNEKDILSNINPDNKSRKITYIPQLYINYLAEKNNKKELNTLVGNILLQDEVYKSYFEEKKSEIDKISQKIELELNNLLAIRANAMELNKQIKEIGASKVIAEAIKKIELQITEGQKLSNLSPEDVNKYNELIKKKEQSDKELQLILTKINVLKRFSEELTTSKNELVGIKHQEDYLSQKGKLDKILDVFTEIPDDLSNIKLLISKDFDVLISNLQNEISKLKLDEFKANVDKVLKQLNIDLAPFLKKLEGQKELKKISEQLEKEKQKKEKSELFEKQLSSAVEEYRNSKKRITNLLKERYLLYQNIVAKINETKKEIGEEITLNCSLLYDKEKFSLYEQANKAAIAKDHFFNKLFIENLVNYDLIPNLFQDIINVLDDNSLKLSSDETIPLKQKTTIDEIFKGIVKDNFDLDYKVTYKNDELLSMSPGKKGTVLLILFLQISSAEYPILIDQPEDNLDNRTIYDLLCKMVIEKKIDRQIIIVSHNANLVVATDSENIIVANQEGQDPEKKKSEYRFEYVNGALEFSSLKNEQIKGVLYQQGIKEHVCDILEGGNEAFKQRERKYAIK